MLLLALVAAELLLCELIALGWIRTVLKIGHEQRYVLSFFVLLGASLLLVSRSLARWPRAMSGVIGALLGQLSSMVAVDIYGLLLPDGIERFGNSLKLGLGGFLISGFWGAFLLGGWLFGAILFLCATWVRGGGKPA
jgi:hypothetical protein